MRFQEIKQLMESEPIPSLSSLWRYSDEFSPEANENARLAALAEIEKIRARNKIASANRKTERAAFVAKDFNSFGFDLKTYLKEYVSSLYTFIQNNPEYASEYVNDPSIITPENLASELVKSSSLNGHANVSPIVSVAIEALTNPGPELEEKYASELSAFGEYYSAVNRLGPVGSQRYRDVLYAEIGKALA